KCHLPRSSAGGISLSCAGGEFVSESPSSFFRAGWEQSREQSQGVSQGCGNELPQGADPPALRATDFVSVPSPGGNEYCRTDTNLMRVRRRGPRPRATSRLWPIPKWGERLPSLS